MKHQHTSHYFTSLQTWQPRKSIASLEALHLSDGMKSMVGIEVLVTGMTGTPLHCGVFANLSHTNERKFIDTFGSGTLILALNGFTDTHSTHHQPGQCERVDQASEYFNAALDAFSCFLSIPCLKALCLSWAFTIRQECYRTALKLFSFWMSQVAPFRSEDMYSRMLQEVFSSAFCESSALVHWKTQQVRRLFDVAAHPRLWPNCAAPKDEACELTKWLSYKTHAIRNCWKRNFNM